MYDGFPDAANSRGIQTNLRVTLSNVTSLSIVFPKHSNDLTVFENPCYDGLQLRINKNYPDKTLNTIGAEFLQMQLIASDLGKHDNLHINIGNESLNVIFFELKITLA